MRKIALVIAAHPDDEVLGCGGTLAKMARNGFSVHGIIVSEGITSRNGKNSSRLLTNLRRENKKSSKIIRFNSMKLLNYPDNKLYSVDFLQLVQNFENIITRLKPSIIFTHHSGDLNIDHEIVNRAVITASRPINKDSVKKILTFETPSSSEWKFDEKNYFIPNYFENIEKYLKYKITALKSYKSEMRKFPHPRSIENIKSIAKVRGSTVGYKYAEAFKVIREIKD
jgi:LmbE family N-acetylglucosaminyl deacetylase